MDMPVFDSRDLVMIDRLYRTSENPKRILAHGDLLRKLKSFFRFETWKSKNIRNSLEILK
jgi:hypothetical protein